MLITWIERSLNIRCNESVDELFWSPKFWLFVQVSEFTWMSREEKKRQKNLVCVSLDMQHVTTELMRCGLVWQQECMNCFHAAHKFQFFSSSSIEPIMYSITVRSSKRWFKGQWQVLDAHDRVYMSNALSHTQFYRIYFTHTQRERAMVSFR